MQRFKDPNQPPNYFINCKPKIQEFIKIFVQNWIPICSKRKKFNDLFKSLYPLSNLEHNISRKHILSVI